MNSAIALNNKSFFLTYSQCDLTKEKLLEEIKKCWALLNRKVYHYVIAAECHKDGGHHLHAYIDLDRSYRGKVESRFLDVEGYHPNIECVRSNKAVLKYCMKENDFISDLPKDGLTKVTKEDIAKKLMTGTTLVEIVEQNPKYLFGYSRLKSDMQQWLLDTKECKALDRTSGVWLAGPSGSGKSTIATTRMGPYYFKGPNKWWDGYNGEETVVLEDVDSSWKDVFTYFKVWADRYPFLAETKGGTIKIRPTRIVVTSNRTIEELLELMGWPKNDYIPYTRRFNEYWITSIDEWDEQL